MEYNKLTDLISLGGNERYVLNNRYYGYPSMMNDGRSVFGGAWEGVRAVDQEEIDKRGFKSNWEYRRHMQNNAVSLMSQNFKNSANEVGYYVREVERHNGIAGKTQTHEVSDLKQLYLDRYELDKRVADRSALLGQEELFGQHANGFQFH
jgi:hypothetical protein